VHRTDRGVEIEVEISILSNDGSVEEWVQHQPLDADPTPLADGLACRRLLGDEE